MNNYKFLQSKIKNCLHYIENNRLVLHKFFNTNPKVKVYEDNIDFLIKKYEDKIVYNCIVEKQKLKLGYMKNKAAEERQIKEHRKHLMKKFSQEPLPVSLKYFNNSVTKSNKNFSKEVENQEPNTQFPFSINDNVSFNKIQTETKGEEISTENEILFRNEHYNNEANWMTDYENFDDNFESNLKWKSDYGTPDPNCSISNIPCGGCGALLHCKDTSIPGYIPSEIFKNNNSNSGQHLKSIICQRCHFLKYYDMALQVRISPEDYPKILGTIKENKTALVILMVDLLDFPCSVWPDIIEIIGRKRPVVIVGNKIDLLPQDSRGYLDKIKNILAESVYNSNLKQANVEHIALISAKTGFGVEELITKLHNIWKYRGDVYLVGCTNVGKSTLFNVLLQSDYCKIKAVDLIQRATTSPWPGTTLNLLKFPILRPSGWRLYVRTKRLMSLNKIASQENKLRKIQLQKTQSSKYATLMGKIERSFSAEEPIDDSKDIFAVQGNSNSSGRTKVGINENDPQFKFSKWCYDTPGVIQPDQTLHLLTTEELMLTLPKELIRPRTFSVKPGFTLFLAGLGRLDFIEGPKSMRFTIFASDKLPITICETKDAETLYKDLIGSELFKVPIGDEKRLEKWSYLSSSNDLTLTGVDWETSCADIVLSSAGWISVTLGHQLKCLLKAWTPEGRGIYVRDSILPKAVSLRGRRIRHSPAYKKSNFFV